MADLQAFPFESAFEGYDPEDNPIYDRAISSATYRQFWKKYFTNGVFFDPATNYQAIAAGGMNVDVSYGEAHIEGLTILPGDATTARLTMPNALTAGDRTDLIVLRADFTANRSAIVYVLEGKSNASDLQRDDSVWELALAKVVVRRNATSVHQTDITDLRLNTEFCGVVTEPITRTNTQQFFIDMAVALAANKQQFLDFIELSSGQWETFKSDTTTLRTQFFTEFEAYLQAHKDQSDVDYADLVGWFDAFKNSSNDKFTTWLDGLKAILDENAAANLLNLIQANQNRIFEIDPDGDGVVSRANIANALDAMAVIDCGSFLDNTQVEIHNADAFAHQNLQIDAFASGTHQSGDLESHEIDPLAHPNLTVDGNIKSE